MNKKKFKIFTLLLGLTSTLFLLGAQGYYNRTGDTAISDFQRMNCHMSDRTYDCDIWVNTSDNTNNSGGTITFEEDTTFNFDIGINGLGGNDGYISWAFYHNITDSGISAPEPYGWTADYDKLDWTGDQGDGNGVVWYTQLVSPTGWITIQSFSITASTPGTYWIEIYGIGSIFGYTYATKDSTQPYSLKVVVTEYDSYTPDVTITDPLDSTDYSGIIDLEATVEDWFLEDVWAEIDDGDTYNETVFMSHDSGDNYIGTWDSSTGTGDGSYTVTIKANDTNGNINNSESVSINIDNTNPAVILSEPTNAADVSGDNLLIQATITDNGVGLEDTWAYITDWDTYSTTIPMSNAGGDVYECTWDTSLVTNGVEYTIYAMANDSVSNLNDSENVYVIVDNELPEITITTPQTNTTQIGGSILTISGFASGTGSIIENIYINNTDWGVFNAPDIDPSGQLSGNYFFSNNTDITPGWYDIEINITDAAGNYNVSYRTFEVVEGDISAPIIVINSITPNPSNGLTTVNITSNELLSGLPLVNVTLPDFSVVYPTVTNYAINKWYFTYSITQDGDYTIRVNGTDMSANTGYCSDIIIGDQQAPLVKIETPIDNEDVKDSVLIRVNATDLISDIDTVIAEITDGGAYSVEIPLSYFAGKYQALWNTKLAAGDKLYTIIIKANDTLGNLNNTESIDVNVDNTSPIINIIFNDDVELGNDAIVRVSITELTGISLVSINYGSGMVPMVLQSGTTYNYTWSVSFPLGTKPFTIFANDTLNNFNSVVGSLDLIDTTGPLMENLTEYDNPVLIGNDAKVQVDAFDLSGIYNVTIEINGLNISSGITDFGNGTYLYQWTPDGPSTYNFWIQDNEGNWASLGGTIGYYENVAPNYLYINHSPNPVHIHDSTTIRVGVIDNVAISSVFISINGNYLEMTHTTGDNWEYSFIPDFVGVERYYINATDSSNNSAILQDFFSVIDLVVPTIISNTNLSSIELNKPIDFSINVEENHDIHNVTIKIGDEAPISMINSDGNSYTYTWVPTELKNCYYTIEVVDISGNINTHTELIVLVPIGSDSPSSKDAKLQSPIGVPIGFAIVAFSVMATIFFSSNNLLPKDYHNTPKVSKKHEKKNKKANKKRDAEEEGISPKDISNKETKEGENEVPEKNENNSEVNIKTTELNNEMNEKEELKE